jgi:hypothetical protein
VAEVIICQLLSITRPRGDISRGPQLVCLEVVVTAMKLCPRVW